MLLMSDRDSVARRRAYDLVQLAITQVGVSGLVAITQVYVLGLMAKAQRQADALRLVPWLAIRKVGALGLVA